MRTTIDLDPDVLAAVERLRAELKLGLSAAVNTLARRGLTAPRADYVYTPITFAMHSRLDDLDNIGEVLELLDQWDEEDRKR